MAALARSLTVAHLVKTYGATRAVDDVSLAIDRGSFVTLLGPSGSGKTTILMAIAGFVRPTSGEILVDQRAITHLPPERRNFGMVFQGYALFPHMTVAENVNFPLRVRRLARAEAERRVARALDLVQLSHLAERYPNQLSGGQQQRVALARALVFEPSLLLLDEPLSALDKKLRSELQEELKTLHRRVGLTFIYVTHDQEEALSLSDRIAILRDGRLVQEGEPAQLYERPATRFVADFLGKSNFLEGTVEERYDGGFRYRVGASGFRQRGAAPAGERVLIALRPEKISLATDGAEADNVVEGVIHAWSYFGTSYAIAVMTADAGLLEVTVPAWRSPLVPREGLRVRLAWSADASVAVTDDR